MESESGVCRRRDDLDGRRSHETGQARRDRRIDQSQVASRTSQVGPLGREQQESQREQGINVLLRDITSSNRRTVARFPGITLDYLDIPLSRRYSTELAKRLGQFRRQQW